MTVVISSGIITAVPAAWTARPTSSSSKIGAMPQMIVPMPNVVIAIV